MKYAWLICKFFLIFDIFSICLIFSTWLFTVQLFIFHFESQTVRPLNAIQRTMNCFLAIFLHVTSLYQLHCYWLSWFGGHLQSTYPCVHLKSWFFINTTLVIFSFSLVDRVSSSFCLCSEGYLVRGVCLWCVSVLHMHTWPVTLALEAIAIWWAVSTLKCDRTSALSFPQLIISLLTGFSAILEPSF